MTAGHKMDENTKEASQQKRDKEKEKSSAASEEGRAGSTGAIFSPSPSFYYAPVLSEGQTPAACAPPLSDFMPSKNAVVGAADSVAVSNTPALNTSPSTPQVDINYRAEDCWNKRIRMPCFGPLRRSMSLSSKKKE